MLNGRLSVSIIVPVFNEEEVLPNFLLQLSEVLDKLHTAGLYMEVIFNDNASTDGSAEVLRAFRHEGSCLILNRFARNYGFQESLLFGLNVARGDCVVVLQSDLQDPPSLILDMVSAWRAGHLTVGARPSERRERKSMAFVRRVYYAVTSWGAGDAQGKGVLDFYLLDRIVVEELKGSAYQGAYLRGLISQTFGFSLVLPYMRKPRTSGKSKFGFGELYEIGMSGLLLQSKRFIQILATSGFALAIFSVLGLAIIAVLWLLGVRTPLAGWFSLTSFILVLLGINSFGFALVFEYLSRTTAIISRPLVPQVRERTFISPADDDE